MAKLTVPSVARARRIVEERLIRMKQQVSAARQQDRERTQEGPLLAQRTALIRARRLAGVAADNCLLGRVGGACIDPGNSTANVTMDVLASNSSQSKEHPPMTNSTLRDIEQHIRYEKLATASGPQYLCSDSLNDDDYRPKVRLLTEEAALAWVAERRKIGVEAARKQPTDTPYSHLRCASS
jgi:hypothetical protein